MGLVSDFRPHILADMKPAMAVLIVSIVAGPRASVAGASEALPTLDQALASKLDLWGEAAMRQTNGASYEFFEKLLPPPRYVNADFKHYPIVLSAPNSKVKARLISNGSGVNLRGGARSWNDAGIPILFRVGPDEYLFGAVADRTAEPALAEGYLPIVEIRYRHRSPVQAEGMVPINQKPVERAPEVYRLEAFASTDPPLAESGVVFVKLSLAEGTNGFVSAEPDAKSEMNPGQGKVTNEQGQVFVVVDKNWGWDRNGLRARLRPKTSAVLAIATKPLSASTELSVNNEVYESQREACVRTWKTILGEGMNVETPEPYVNAAWRHLICQNFQLVNGDRIHYSAGNQYDRLYEAEGSDAALAMMNWGYESDMRRLMVPLFAFTRKGLEFHQAGFKINNLCQYYWQTRDATVVKELRSHWEREARRLVDNRTGEHGLFPKEQYCGDIHTPVQSVNVNAKAWRALRDLSTVLAAVGERKEAEDYASVAGAFRKTVLTAIKKSARRETTPPFVPVALYDNEPIHDPITQVRIGSYWNIIIGYTISSGIFAPGSEEEHWIPHYLEQHGGLCMGMLRSGGSQHNFWTGYDRVNPLYGTRYTLDTLRRDDPERALVSLYGMLAQGFTRNTFICGEGCSLPPVDERGRIFYCPPNSAANAHFLSMLRNALVQDWDLDDDGQPETLRLLFATPKRWLNDGQTITVERAPTAFGDLSVKATSRLSQGEVVAEVDLPQRQLPKQTLLRIRVPDGWRIVGADVAGKKLPADARGTADISDLKGKAAIRFRAEKL
jgi:hypothetical protein